MTALGTEARAARDAVGRGLLLARRSAATASLSYKDDGRDVVTTADIAVEDEIRATLVEAFGWPVIGEERGGVAPSDGSPYWLLDPICGTRNFASGIPLWCVNLALVQHKEVVVAAVGDASTDDVCVAERGGGAWGFRAGAARPLTSSGETSVIVADAGKCAGEKRARAARFAAGILDADTWDVRAPSSTVGFSWVAAGRAAAYALFFAPTVHLAAGVLLASEAGATVSDIDGDPWSADSDSALVAATPALHEALLSEARR